MKNTILSYLRFLFWGNFRTYRSIFLFTTLNLGKTNKISLRNSIFKFSHFNVIGCGNEIEIKSDITKSTIHIEGCDNKLIIEEDVIFNNIDLYIVGNSIDVVIGKRTQFHRGYMYAGGRGKKLIIGNDCLFAHDVDIMNSDSHQILQNGAEINKSKDVIIGNHVWVAAHCSILKGVTIGSNVVIGLGSIVAKDLPDNVIAAGTPCRVLREDTNWSIERNT